MKIQDAKSRHKSPSGHHRTTLSGYIFATKALIDNRKKVIKQQCLPHMSLEYGELRSTSGWDLLASLGHPSTFQRVSRLGIVIARHCGSGRELNFEALHRGRHLYLAGRPWRWALAHILVIYYFSTSMCNFMCIHAMYSYTKIYPSVILSIHIGCTLCMSCVCAAAKECVPDINKTPQDVAGMVSAE